MQDTTAPTESNSQEVQPQTVDPSLMPGASLNSQTITQFQYWQGQFPPPAAVREYEAICPGAFDRIIGMAENQQRLAAEAGADARTKQANDTRRGQILGALVTFGAICGSLYCAQIGQPWVAGALVAVPIMSVAKAFIDGRINEAPGSK